MFPVGIQQKNKGMLGFHKLRRPVGYGQQDFIKIQPLHKAKRRLMKRLLHAVVGVYSAAFPLYFGVSSLAIALTIS
jgi:hypothetical protein